MDMSQCEQKDLVSISPLKRLAHSLLGLGKVIRETLIKTLSLALSLFLLLLFSPLLYPFLFALALSSPNGVYGVASTRHEVLIAATKERQTWEVRDLLSPFHLPLFPPPLPFSLLCEPAGPGEGFNLREQRIPWQRSTDHWSNWRQTRGKQTSKLELWNVQEIFGTCFSSYSLF